MSNLTEKFYEILVSHNHELVMSGVWLADLADELAKAAQSTQQALGLHAGCGGEIVQGDSFCRKCGMQDPPATSISEPSPYDIRGMQKLIADIKKCTKFYE